MVDKNYGLSPKEVYRLVSHARRARVRAGPSFQLTRAVEMAGYRPEPTSRPDMLKPLRDITKTLL